MMGTDEARQRAVLVTGTSSGLGLATAVYLAERGFRVYATMRNLARRHQLDEEAAHRGASLDVLQLDVTDRSSIEAAVDTAIAQSGAIYGLVNNAGTQVRGFFEDLSDAEIRQVFETNVFGTMAVTRAVLPHMRTAGQGRIVIMTSVAGRLGSMGLSAYSASKFALEGFGEALALEMAPLGIWVSLVEPAIIKTEIWGSNRHVAAGALDPNSPYFTWFQASERLANRLVRAAPTRAADVAKVVHQILTARRPRLRYLVGRRAGLLLTLRRYLPDVLFDRLYLGMAHRAIRTNPGAR